MCRQYKEMLGVLGVAMFPLWAYMLAYFIWYVVLDKFVDKGALVCL